MSGENIKIVAGLLLSLFLIPYSLYTAASAQSSQTQILITWQARNFYPADFAGKSRITEGATVIASVAAIRDSQILDLQKASITWLLDGKIIGSEKKEIIFTASKGAGDAHLLKVSVKIGVEVLETTLRLPITKPQVILESSLSGKTVFAGSQIEFQAVPYFFNVSTLSGLDFIWKINQQTQNTIEFNRLTLNVGEIAAPTTISVNSFVQNRSNPFEVAKTPLELTAVK